jgi:hypothetical protein
MNIISGYSIRKSNPYLIDDQHPLGHLQAICELSDA